MLFRFLLACVLLTTHQLRAQDTPSPRSVRDSAYAVRNLFRERRLQALQGGSIGLAGISGGVFELVNHQPGFSGGIFLLTSFFTALDVRQLSRYSESREELVVTRYEQGWPLPPKVRRRLKGKYFHALK